MVWSIVGLSTCLAVAVLAWWRSRTPAGFYDGEVYGMTQRGHLRYLAIELVGGAAFLGTLLTHADTLAAWLFAAVALVDVFYLTSFLRGASEDEQ